MGMPTIELYGATRGQDGQGANEDAFLIGRGNPPLAALADGAGNAARAANRVLRLFEKLLQDSPREEINRFPAWRNWIALMHSSLLRGPQSTFVGVVVSGERLIGASVGDSRAYLIDERGQLPEHHGAREQVAPR